VRGLDKRFDGFEFSVIKKVSAGEGMRKFFFY